MYEQLKEYLKSYIVMLNLVYGRKFFLRKLNMFGTRYIEIRLFTDNLGVYNKNRLLTLIVANDKITLSNGIGLSNERIFESTEELNQYLSVNGDEMVEKVIKEC